VIVDASTLDWLPMGAAAKNAIRVLTPHPGEAARLLNLTRQQVQANRPKALHEISRRFGNCWVVLKGHQTLVGRSEGEIFVNPSAIASGAGRQRRRAGGVSRGIARATAVAMPTSAN